MTIILPREREIPERLTALGDYVALEEGNPERKLGMNQSKWVLNSLTMWGAFVTGVSASLPSLNTFLTYFLDYSIEPEWIAAMNEGVKNVIMGVGGLAGLVMVVWGRWNAKTELKIAPK